MRHDLKIWPQYYCHVKNGNKTFEVRKNDRGFQPGDTVVLREYDTRMRMVESCGGPDAGWNEEVVGYTSSHPLTFRIGYVLPIDAERVVFSLLTAAEGEMNFIVAVML